MTRALWSRRDLIRQFAVRYFLQRYRGTYLGVFWALLFPLAMLSVYTFVFNTIFAGRWSPHADETRSQYAVVLFCGLTVYGMFSETVVRSCGLVLDNPTYVTKVVFPVEVLPVASLASTVMFSMFSLALVLIGTAVFFGTLHWTVLLLPLVLLPMLMIALGLAWFLASLAVFVRDVGNIVVLVVTQILFFATPIFYKPEQIPVSFRPVAMLNPLAHVVDGARRVVIFGEQPDWRALAIVAVVGLLMMQMGYAWFMKAKRGFADVI